VGSHVANTPRTHDAGWASWGSSQGTMDLATRIGTNLTEVRHRISTAAESAGRSAASVQLVAVSKTFGVEHVEAAVAAGLLHLGENKLQEAVHKHAATPSLPIHWHLIGHLQSNKTRKAASVFDWVHSVDSVAVLDRLDRAAAECGRAPQVLIQVDLAGETTKHGAPETEIPRIIEAASACSSVVLRGLMTLPPWSRDPEATRPYFRRLRELGDRLRPLTPHPDAFDQLSIGMSHDLEVAIAEGATMVRVGTALFGPRPTPGSAP
jgi:pyridoxal phosphate enzyme (YggS family)